MAQVRVARQERFYKARMARSKEVATAAERRELERDIALVRAPDALLQHGQKEKLAPQKMLIPLEAPRTEDRMVE